MEIINVTEAVEVLKRGELVIIPTETVYGLAADGFNEKAVEKIFEAKNRPKKNPSILHVSSVSMLEQCVMSISDKARLLIDAFWPGPLTLVFRKKDIVPDIVTAGLDTVCVRMPNHPLTLKLIEILGRPIAAPSANISSRPSSTTLDAAIADLEKRGVKFALDASGDTRIGLESTIIDLTTEKPLLLRLGGLAQEKIEEVLGEKLQITDKNGEVTTKAPGMAFKHYSPLGEVILIYPWEVFGEKISKKLSSRNGAFYSVEEAFAAFYQDFHCGIICNDERAVLYEGYEVLKLGPAKDNDVQARQLFKILLETEKLGWQKIFIDMTNVGGEIGLGPAIIERLRRAAEI